MQMKSECLMGEILETRAENSVSIFDPDFSQWLAEIVVDLKSSN